MGEKQFHTRLDEDTAEWVEQFREERDITKAEAMRRLVRAGKRKHEREQQAAAEQETAGVIAQLRQWVAGLSARSD